MTGQQCSGFSLSFGYIYTSFHSINHVTKKAFYVKYNVKYKGPVLLKVTTNIEIR